MWPIPAAGWQRTRSSCSAPVTARCRGSPARCVWIWLPSSLDAKLRDRNSTAYNSFAPDARAEVVEIRFCNVDLGQPVILGIGDSPFADVGKKRTSSEAGPICLFADSTDNRLLRGGATIASPLVWGSHRIKRVVRSTLAGETLDASEVVEAGDVMRAHMVNTLQGIECRKHAGYQKALGTVHALGRNSLNDLVNKRGTSSSEESDRFWSPELSTTTPRRAT